MDASHVYVRAWALGCFQSLTSTQTFRRALTASVDSCADIKSAPSGESSDSEMPYDSSDEEVWEEEEVSGDDDSDGGPGFLDPTRRHSLPGM